MVMGPVISAKAKEFILAMIATGLKEARRWLSTGGP